MSLVATYDDYVLLTLSGHLMKSSLTAPISDAGERHMILTAPAVSPDSSTNPGFAILDFFENSPAKEEGNAFVAPLSLGEVTLYHLQLYGKLLYKSTLWSKVHLTELADIELRPDQVALMHEKFKANAQARAEYDALMALGNSWLAVKFSMLL